MGHIHHNQMKEKQFGGVKVFLLLFVLVFFALCFVFYTDVCVMLVIFFDVLPF